jgi:asparaginyl-tRNA synthetase
MVQLNYLQSTKTKAILSLRAKVIDFARKWLNSQGFVEVQGPVLIPAVGERPGSFEVRFFDKISFLSSGLQPYSDPLVDMLEKVYTIAPAFRAERFVSKTHLAEFWRIETVARGLDLEGAMKVQEELVAQVLQKLCKECPNELKLSGGSVEKLAHVKSPFLRISYQKAVDRLADLGCEIYWGMNLSSEMEESLSDMFDAPFFIKEFPVSGETYFHATHPENPELSLCADLVAPDGFGEIASSAQMITNKKELQRKLKAAKIESADKKWYSDLKRYSDEPQSGFSLGIERILRWISMLDDIKEATAFPRSFEENYP